MTARGKWFFPVFVAASVFFGIFALTACGKAHTHAYGEWEVTAPTLSAKGSAKKVCKDCEEGTEGHTVTVSLPVLSDAGYTKSADTATCTAGGEVTYSITVEGNDISFTVATIAKAHKFVLHAAADKTCTQDGNKKFYTCETCDTYFTEAFEVCTAEDTVIPAAHTYGEWEVTAPTADGTGTATKTCSVCEEGTEGHAVTLTLPALSDARYTVTGDTATCEEAGTATYSATVEGVDISFTAATSPKGHKLGTLHAAVEATCENAGNPAYYECENCHHYFGDEGAEEEIEDIVIPAAHQYVEHAAVEATCQRAGNSKYYDCPKCQRYFDENKVECEENSWVIEQIEHTKELLESHYTGTEIGKNYCTESFEMEHWHCTMCNKDYDADMQPLENLQHAPLGHDFEGVEQTPAVAATCTADGMPAYYECKRCHEHYVTNDAAATNTTTVKAIPSTGHHWVSDGALGDPSPEGGKISVRCGNANCTEKQEIDYKGTLALTGTSSAPVQIDSAGQYYVKGTKAGYAYFSIPITKAGTYRVDFINLDASRAMTTHNTAVSIYDSSSAQAGKATLIQGKQFNPQLAATYGTLTGELGGDRSFRWFELQAEETLVGGKVTFAIYFSLASADSPFPVVIDVKISDPAPAEVAAKEYAVLPGKSTADGYTD